MPRILCALIKGKSAEKGAANKERERPTDPNANEIFRIIFKLIEMNYVCNA